MASLLLILYSSLFEKPVIIFPLDAIVTAYLVRYQSFAFILELNPVAYRVNGDMQFVCNIFDREPFSCHSPPNLVFGHYNQKFPTPSICSKICQENLVNTHNRQVYLTIL